EPNPQERLQHQVVEGGHSDIHDERCDGHDKTKTQGKKCRRQAFFQFDATALAGSEAGPKQIQREKKVRQIWQESDHAEFLEDLKIFGVSDYSTENCFRRAAAQEGRSDEKVASIAPQGIEPLVKRIGLQRIP